MKVPIQESITYGWNKFWERPWFFVGVYIIIGIISSNLQSQSQRETPNIDPFLMGLLIVIGLALAAIRIVIRMGEKRLLLNAYENVQSASVKDLWTPHPFWRFVGASILYGLIIVGGLILLIVPGIIWALKYMFVPIIVIDRGMYPMEALRESARITTNHKWELFLLCLVLAGVNILGALCLLVGLLVSVPVSALATVYVYRFLERQVSEISTVRV